MPAPRRAASARSRSSPSALTREPAGPGVRVDSGVVEGSEISRLYDPLVAKLCVWDTDRERARARMLRALDEFEIEGVETLLGFHRALLRRTCFAAGETCHGVVESEKLAQEAEELSHGTTTIGPASDGRVQEHTVEIEVNDRRFEVTLLRQEPPFAQLARRRRERAGGSTRRGAARDAVVSPMQGTVLAVEVVEGDEVRAGQVICIVEAMKMENEITAHREGLVSRLTVSPGETVKTGQVICIVAREEESDGDPAAH